jgi:predicted negative regulator of RcsB-dependent stress response
MHDQELVESLTRFWKKFGNAIIVFVIAFAVGIAIWRYWDAKHEADLEQASNIYQAILIANAEHKGSDVIDQSNYLISQYPDTAYAQMARLLLASQYVAQNDMNAAINQLQNLIADNKSGPIHAIASLRLARIFIAQNQPNEALSLLQNIPSGFDASYNLEKGDAYAELNQYSQALASYQEALQSLPPNDASLQYLIQLHISQLKKADS